MDETVVQDDGLQRRELELGRQLPNIGPVIGLVLLALLVLGIQQKRVDDANGRAGAAEATVDEQNADLVTAAAITADLQAQLTAAIEQLRQAGQTPIVSGTPATTATTVATVVPVPGPAGPPGPPGSSAPTPTSPPTTVPPTTPPTTPPAPPPECTVGLLGICVNV